MGEVRISAWLTDHLPAYAPTFLASSRVETIHYWAPGDDLDNRKRVAQRANLLANWSEERMEMIGRILISVAAEEPD